MKLVKPNVSIEEALREPEEWIPNGIYCYVPSSDNKTIGYLCPFWDRKEGRPHMENGYCHYLQVGDDLNGEYLTLLWDMCKECGINDECEEE